MNPTIITQKKKDQPDQNPSITSLKQGKATNET